MGLLYLVVLAGVLWAAGAGSALGVVYALACIAGHAVFLSAIEVDGGLFAETVAHVAPLVALGLLADSVASIDGRAIQLSAALDAAPAVGSGLEFRRRLSAVVGTEGLPVDGILAGVELGLTAQQVELLSFLILGLSNQQIAEAWSVSEATVKARLTALYRRMDVDGRRGAVTTARRLGLGRLSSDGSAPPRLDAPIVAAADGASGRAE